MIKLNQFKNPIWINPDHIIYLALPEEEPAEDQEESYCVFMKTLGDCSIYLDESIEEILEAIKKDKHA